MDWWEKVIVIQKQHLVEKSYLQFAFLRSHSAIIVKFFIS